MSYLIIYVVGYILFVIVFGVVNKAGMCGWQPNGHWDGDELNQLPPHMVAGISWPLVVAGYALVWACILMYRGFNKLTDFLVSIKIERNNE